MNYDLLKDLLGYLETYQENHASQQVRNFAVWLANEMFTEKKDSSHAEHDQLLIAFKVMHVNKELKKQTKSVLAPTNLSSIDEYSFLLHLAFQDSFRKMELVELHNLEAPTGIEIIKRLLKKQLVEEFPDEEDKRAKRLRITKAGSAELNAVRPKVETVFSGFTASLNLNESIQLSGILDKMIR